MIYVMPVDEMGCGYYRLIWPVQILKHHGFDIKIIQPGKRQFFINQNNNIVVPPDTELIVMQRPASVFHIKLIEALRQAGIAVVIDMDDDLTAVDPTNRAFHFYRHHNDKIFSWKYTVEACRQATLITTSTPALLKTYEAEDRGVVLRNYVPAAYLEMEPRQVATFGWAGNTYSHYNDLGIISSTVRDLTTQGYEFRVVGGDRRMAHALRLDTHPIMTGDVPFFRWTQAISEHIGVGLVPLAPTKFNTGKSRLKGIEYMAAGVPWVASPREEYRELHRESGCGALADTPKQWYTIVKKLLDDGDFRQSQVEMGRAYMSDQTYEAQAWRWAEAWQSAIDRQVKS
jgi:Glycosyl transferases group 1